MISTWNSYRKGRGKEVIFAPSSPPLIDISEGLKFSCELCDYKATHDSNLRREKEKEKNVY